MVDSKIIRGSFISKKLKLQAELSDIGPGEIAYIMGGKTHQPTISTYLNGKRIPSDEYYTKIGKAIGLSEKEINNIFHEADVEEFNYKYPDDHETTMEEDLAFIEKFDVALSREFGVDMDAETVSRIRGYIEGIIEEDKR